jgi:hypothetical protein
VLFDIVKREALNVAEMKLLSEICVFHHQIFHVIPDMLSGCCLSHENVL